MGSGRTTGDGGTQDQPPPNSPHTDHRSIMDGRAPPIDYHQPFPTMEHSDPRRSTGPMTPTRGSLPRGTERFPTPTPHSEDLQRQHRARSTSPREAYDPSFPDAARRDTQPEGTSGGRRHEDHISGRVRNRDSLEYVDTCAHEGETWGGRPRGFEPPGKDLRIFSHFTLIFDEVTLHLQTQKDAHTRAMAIRGVIRTVDHEKLEYITTDLRLNCDRVKAALMSGIDDEHGQVSHPGFDQLHLFHSIQTIGLFADPMKLQGFIDHTGWTAESYGGLTLRDYLPAHVQAPHWGEDTEPADRALLREAVTNLSKSLRVVHHRAFRGVEQSMHQLADRRFGNIANGIIRFHLEEAITTWALDVSTHDRPSLRVYAHVNINTAEWAAQLLECYLNDVMSRFEGIGFSPTAPHLLPYEAYPHSRFFRPGGVFQRITATDTGRPTSGPITYKTPGALLATSPTPSAVTPAGGPPPLTPPATQPDTSIPCLWHICALAGITKVRPGVPMACDTPNCPAPHPASLPVITQEMFAKWGGTRTKLRLQAALPHKIPLAWL